MRHNTWRTRGAVVAACLCALAVSGGSASAAEAPARGTQEAIRLQQLAKRRFQELIRIMGDTSRRLEATDRKTAEAIAAAAQKAESALIADEWTRWWTCCGTGSLFRRTPPRRSWCSVCARC